jgi:diaminohydroxyphosphoribosylaminopyrimidine deaminase/5-amino-6-(5-phosphoribosylamino)uracil reductase
MRRALLLARRGLGRVSPNPPVGAVAVQGGKIVGEGWHREFGGSHAEAELITRITDAGRGAELLGADLHVTLEPCDHYGKTPPCSEAVIAAKFRRVIVACDDPNPVTRGKSYQRFAAAGIEVVRGSEEAAARELLAPYFCRTIAGRPLVTAKWAMTADGRIATSGGDSRWISSEETRRRTRSDRSSVDAILVGSTTARVDDPLLTARTRGRPDPRRIVLDSSLSLSPESRLVASAADTPLLVVGRTARENETGFVARRAALEDHGAEVLLLPDDGASRIAIPALLELLGSRGVCHLLVEGGAIVLGSFFDAGAVDRVQVVIAPKIAGGAAAPSPVGGGGVVRMAEAWSIEGARWRKIGSDQILEGSITAVGRGEWPDPLSG